MTHHDGTLRTAIGSPIGSPDDGRLASEARHGAAQWRHTCVLTDHGWVSGLDWEGHVWLARIMSTNAQPYCREWREPEWPIYRAALTPKGDTP